MRIGISSQGVTNYTRQIGPTGSTLIQSGCLGGSVTYALNTASLAASASYSAYDNCAGWIVNGTASGTGTYAAAGTLSSLQDSVRLDLSFSSLQYTRKADGATFRLSGTMRIDKIPADPILVSTSFPGYVVTMNASLFDASDAPVLSVQDLVVHSDPKSPSVAAEGVRFSGHIIDPILGFVDAISPARMIFSLSSGGIGSGSFTMQGATTQAVVTYTNGAFTTSIESAPINNNPLDASFGTGGKVTTDFTNGSDSAGVLARQPDGKLLVGGLTFGGGSTRFVLARYNENGSLDTAFGTGGTVTTTVFSEGSPCRCMVLQPDGKIVVAGTTLARPRNFQLARYDSDGNLDLTFGTNGTGTVTTAIDAQEPTEGGTLLLQPDGKLVLIGTHVFNEYAVVRYNPDGSLDGTFGSGGIVTTATPANFLSVTAAVIQPDGKIVVGGSADSAADRFELVRYSENGSLDLGFNGTGKVQGPGGSINAKLTGLLLQPDGKLIASGLTSDGTGNVVTVARYLSNGSFDTTFATNGIAKVQLQTGIFSSGNSVLQADGKVVVIGSTQYGPFDRIAVLRLDAIGTQDTTFGTNGVIFASIGNIDAAGSALLLQPDGKLIAAGSAMGSGGRDFVLTRYLP